MTDPLTIAAAASAAGTTAATALLVVSSRDTKTSDTPTQDPTPVDRWWENLPTTPTR